jgi:hexosaminidase
MKFALLLLALALSPFCMSQTAPLPMMPLPANVHPGTGQLVIDNNFNVQLQGVTEPRMQRARDRFLNTLSHETGVPLWWSTQANHPAAKLIVNAKAASKEVQELGEDESYRLTVTPTQATIDAANPLGAMHGLQTFLQLVQSTPQGFAVPAVTIDDSPRFPWRGLMIDSARHFMPLEVIRRNLDAMEAVKLNVFHWHLSDNQGFRIESKKYPKLQEQGSDGLFYTQEEARDIIAYARDRGIRVIPEFDMPGHTTAWFVGYPDLASGNGPYQIERKWGIFDPAMDPTRDSTYDFVDGLVGEMAALFPDAYFHIGGDEVNGKEWDANPRIQQWKRDHNISTNEALQAQFSTRVQKIVAKHGKIATGWDEVLTPDAPKDIVIQSWRGQDSLAAAARQGNRGILSFGYYLDLMQPASFHYGVDPLAKGAASLDPQQKQLILGGEACMWSEFATRENMDERIWPRAAAVAERLWSPQNVTDVQSMYDRLALVSQKLDYYGLHHNTIYPQMLQRMTGDANPQRLKVLGDVVEPTKIYTRGEQRDYNQFTPLNRLVDAVPPESDVARNFADLTNRIVTRHANAQDVSEARQWLNIWRVNDAALQPVLSKSDITAELAPLSQGLTQTATIGLQALQYLQAGGAPAGWKARQVAFLKQQQQPQAVLLNMIAPSVQKMVEATRVAAAQPATPPATAPAPGATPPATTGPKK